MSATVINPDALVLGPGAAGLALEPSDFDTAEFESGSRYQLINGVLVVSPATSPEERGPNEELALLLKIYQRTHENGFHLNDTLPEHDISVGSDRRRADRVIWTGLGRQPRRNDIPTIVVEFVSAGKRNVTRNYEDKRVEYNRIGIKEYWVINRFERTMTIFKPETALTVIHESDIYATELLPGFELPLASLLAVADQWANRID